jgi:hypothetical protein
LSQDERKRNSTENPRTPAGSLSVAGGRGERKRDPTGNPRTPVGSLSVAGGRGWVEVESAGSLFPSPDLSVSGGPAWGVPWWGGRVFLLDGAGHVVLQQYFNFFGFS